MKTGIIVATTAILTALALFNVGTNTFRAPNKADIAFVKWTLQNSKMYTPKEFVHRLSIFTANYNKVTAHNASNTESRLSLNKFADLATEEFKAKYLGFRPSTTTKNFADFTPSNADSVDWRKGPNSIVNAVKDQGQCGSCWAFSTIAALEGNYAQTTGTLKSFSEQQLVDCSGAYGNQGCNGGLMDNAFKYLQKFSIELESDYTYHARDGHCKYNAAKGVTMVSTYTDVQHSEAALQSAVDTGVIAVAVDAEQWQLYSGGVFSNCGTSLDHGVAAVGYAPGFWIVRNSWAASWGEEGYIRLKKGVSGSSGTCGILKAASYPMVKK